MKYKFVLSSWQHFIIKWLMATVIYYTVCITPFTVYMHYYDKVNINVVTNEVSPMDVYPALGTFMYIMMLIMMLFIFRTCDKISNWILNQFHFNIAFYTKPISEKKLELLGKIMDLNLKYEADNQCHFCGLCTGPGFLTLHKIRGLYGTGCTKCYEDISRQFLAEVKEHPELYK